MSRINTNVMSLTAQRNLLAANQQVNRSMERLSSGLRINRGADDPAGLIMSERLRSEKVALQAAINNNIRAANLLSTAEAGLGEINTLLLDIQGLVDVAANSGGMTSDDIAANQLLLDEAVDSITRIADGTQFNGKKLLDGSLDGGAKFQVGAEISSTNQIVVTIPGVDADSLGVTAALSTLKAGGSNALDGDNLVDASSIVKEAIATVSSLRSRLGAVQANTLQSQIRSLSTTLENITSAESAIRDTDFAEETANMTRAQILVQAGTSVLAMANSAPQNVLALLG
ncbi:MAG: flagellin FliC [Anaerolineaceae bacterium]|nr:flagellin FliC [Anaerolineaceae bacterium]